MAVMGDKIIFEMGGSHFGVDTSVVCKVTEVDKVFFVPGQAGIVNGVISLAGEPVTVINCRRLLGAGPIDKNHRHKIIVVKDKKRLIGFDVGSANLTFVWSEKVKDAEPSRAFDFTSGSVEAEGTLVSLLNWAALFEEAKKILSAEGPVA